MPVCVLGPLDEVCFFPVSCFLLVSRFLALNVWGYNILNRIVTFCCTLFVGWVVMSFYMLRLGCFEVPGILSLRVFGFLGLWLFGPMTLKPGSAASRSVNNSKACNAQNANP